MDPEFDKLQKFLSSCSIQSLGDLLLVKLSHSQNVQADFAAQAEVLLRAALKLIEMAESWAQNEAESRYVNYVRESAKLLRDSDVIEAKKVIVKRQKLLVR